MSQAGIISTSSGPVPPTVATSYVTDDGTAIPAANILNVNGIDSTTNNANGIFTQADPNGSNNLRVVLSNRIQITATTSDGAGQTQAVTLFTPTDDTAITFSALIIGYDAPNNVAAGGSQQGVARKTGGAVTIVGTNDSLDESDAALNAVDWDVIATGADLQGQFVGIAGRTITWTMTFTYTQTP